MSLGRVVAIIGVVFYVVLWILALNGAANLVVPLVIPLVLVLLVWGGLALNRFLGIAPRKEHFDDREDETDK